MACGLPFAAPPEVLGTVTFADPDTLAVLGVVALGREPNLVFAIQFIVNFTEAPARCFYGPEALALEGRVRFGAYSPSA